eukprot:gi/632967738/ref/XP_007900147.1/ PREDICTED: chromosome-associated kinesin KIF4-like isoform X2 [Callorhinchus milii]
MEEVPVQVAVGLQQVSDTGDGHSAFIEAKDSKSLSIASRNSGGEKSHSFTFDVVFDPDSEQERVYLELVRPLICKARTGYNTSLVVSGTHTGSKARLLLGDELQTGIMHKLLKDLFEDLELNEEQKTLATVSHIQLHTDGSALDLLNPHDRTMRCVQHPVLGLVVEELSEFVVGSCEEAWSLYRQGREAERLAGDLADRCSSLFTVTLEQREVSAGVSVCRSSVRVYELPGSAGNGVSPLKRAVDEAKIHTEPGLGCTDALLSQALGGNRCSVLISFLHLPESWPGEAALALSLARSAALLTNQVRQNRWDPPELTQKLRLHIRQAREQLGSGKDVSQQEAEHLAQLVHELQVVKKQRWEKKRFQSQHCRAERKQHLIAKGFLELALKLTCSEQQRVQLAEELRQTQQQIREVKERLKNEVGAYLKAEHGDESELEVIIGNIQQLQTRLKQSESNLKGLRHKQDQLHSATRAGYEGSPSAESEIDLLYATGLEKRKCLEEENMALIERELSKMDEHRAEKAGGSEAAGGPQGSTGLRREQELLVLYLVTLRREKAEAERDLRALYQQCRLELERQRCQSLEMLRMFREVSENQREAQDKRYRKLLEEAIQDTLYLAAQTQHLELENRQLKDAMKQREQQAVHLQPDSGEFSPT